MERTNTKKFTANTRNRRYKGYGAGYTGLEHSPLGRGYNVNDYDLNDPLVVDGEEWIVVLQHGMRVFERLNPNRERVPFVPIVPEATPAKKKTKTPKPATASKPEPEPEPQPEIIEEPIVPEIVEAEAKPEPTPMKKKPVKKIIKPIAVEAVEAVEAVQEPIKPIVADAKTIEPIKPKRTVKPKTAVKAVDAIQAEIIEEPIVAETTPIKPKRTVKPKTDVKAETTPLEPKKTVKAVDPKTPPATADIVNDAIDVADVKTTKKAVTKAKTIVIASSSPDVVAVAKEASEAVIAKPKRASRAKKLDPEPQA